MSKELLQEVLDYFDRDTTNVPMQIYKKVFNTLYPPKKEKLFTTEDGVDVHYGDKTYSLTDNFDVFHIVWNEYPRYTKGTKYFSTREVAKEYALMNKPCLSVNEVVEIVKGESDGTYKDNWGNWNFTNPFAPQAILEKIKHIAKTKINQK